MPIVEFPSIPAHEKTVMYINCKIVHVCADLEIVVGGGGGGGGGGAAWKRRHTSAAWEKWKKSNADPEGWGGGSGPPWKITSYMWFYRE